MSSIWKDGQYVYTSHVLRDIARSYATIYEGLELTRSPNKRHETPVKYVIDAPRQIAEFKADFDTALSAIGKGHWLGNSDDYTFRDFRHFGRLQQLVIADVYRISDQQLTTWHFEFNEIPKLRGIAYWRMRQYLNDSNEI